MKESKKIGLYLFLYTRGEISPAEQEELLVWRNQDPDNEKLFFQMTDPGSLRKEMQDYYKERDRDFEKLKARLPFLSGTRLSGSYSENSDNDSETRLMEDKSQVFFSEDEYVSSGLSPMEYWGAIISDPGNLDEKPTGLSSKGRVINLMPETETPKSRKKQLFMKWFWRVACLLFFVIRIYQQKPKSDSDRFQASLLSSDAVDKSGADMSRGYDVGRAGIKITHNDAGEPVYIVPNERKAAYTKTYLLRTPADGEFILQLPDSTLIWLNGSSSVRYPANFDQRNITIEVTGEVFVETSKDSFHHFQIIGLTPNAKSLTLNAGPSSRININAYSDDDGLLVTLISGDADIDSNSTEKGFHFTNGKQTVSIHDSLSYLQNVNAVDVISWRNGTFYYRQAPIQNIMPAIARWFDMDVQYPFGFPDKKFNLRMERSAALTDILQNLKSQGLHVTHSGKNITIWK